MKPLELYEETPYAWSARPTEPDNMPPEFTPEELSKWSHGIWSTVPKPMYGVCHDTRTLEAMNLYVALSGDRFDGHDFVDAAFEQGASAALVSRKFASVYDGSEALLIVEDTLAALQQIASGYRQELYAEMFAVTGSVGKTTVKELIAGVLSNIGPVTRTPGNWNNHIGVPLSVLSMDRDSIFGVFEIGMNQPGDLKPLCDILKPRWGIMTPVGPAHIGAFEDMEGIVAEKSVMLQSLPPEGVAILNKDDTWYERFRAAAPRRVVTVSLKREADFKGSYDPTTGHLLIHDRGDGSSHAYDLPLTTGFFIEDVLLAVAVGREHGIPHEKINEVIRAYTPPPMRWDQSEVNGVAFVNDAYNANPMSMKASLEAFSRMKCEGKRWAVLGCMLELGKLEKSEHIALGRAAAASSIDGVITVGELGVYIAKGARENGRAAEEVIQCEDNRIAADVLMEKVSPGDAVLLKASRAQHLEEVLDYFKNES